MIVTAHNQDINISILLRLKSILISIKYIVVRLDCCQLLSKYPLDTCITQCDIMHYNVRLTLILGGTDRFSADILYLSSSDSMYSANIFQAVNCFTLLADKSHEVPKLCNKVYSDFKLD